MRNKTTLKIIFLFGLIASPLARAEAQSDIKDILIFGAEASEHQHQLVGVESKASKGALDQTTRTLLPQQTPGFKGGKVGFKMAVDPEKQNYFTVKLWGSDRDKTEIMLFADGKQVGYRHLGDIEFLWFGNGEPPFNNRFIYMTIPLPIQQTKGKSSIDLELCSYGEIWPYGMTFDVYQKKMISPSLGVYRAYTHTNTMIEPPKEEVQGKSIPDPPIRKGPGEEILVQLKDRVNNELRKILNSNDPPNQLEMMFLAQAYQIKWTDAYHSERLISKVIDGMDEHYRKYLNDPDLIHTDKNIYNGDWTVTGPIGRAIHQLWPQLKSEVDKTFSDGKGNMITHRQAWSTLMEQGVQFSITRRRQYTNQSMIVDLFIYDCNEALRLLEPKKALPEAKTLHYLYEAVGLTPWLGKETPNGPERSLGDNYWELTGKGLTKELGFVGYYGEVLDWVNEIYRDTQKSGVTDSGDPQIRKQLIKLALARSYFRYPEVDDDGYKAMRAETVVGWRDANHYPGNITYGDRAIAWDASPLMSASSTLDPALVGIAQQMIADNQFFNTVAEKLKLSGLRATKSLLDIPDQYDLIKKQTRQSFKLPMTNGMPDFIFADEEDGVVALKNGTDRLYVSLYWRAHSAINKLAKVHFITPDIDRLSNIYIESEYEPSGMTFTRPDRVNIKTDAHREFYKDLHSAHAGEELPIAKIPDGVKFKPGDENVYAGRASFYNMQYGRYLIGMNTTTDKTFELPVPAGFEHAVDLSTHQSVGDVRSLKVGPRSTVVLYIK